MHDLARITLFVHDRKGRLETVPDQAVQRTLPQEAPLITHQDDGSRTLVSDLVPEARPLAAAEPVDEAMSLDPLRICGAALGRIARMLGLPLAAALAESAEMVAEAELRSMTADRRH